MPVMDGVALLRVVRQRWPKVVRVLMSSSGPSSLGPGDLTDRFLEKGRGLAGMTAALLGLIQR
jgi:CheY-like chemotaxis protein